VKEAQFQLLESAGRVLESPETHLRWFKKRFRAREKWFDNRLLTNNTHKYCYLKLEEELSGRFLGFDDKLRYKKNKFRC